MRWMRRIASVAVVASTLTAGVAVGASAAAVDAPPSTTYTYAPTDEVIWNPDRGIYWDGQDFQALTPAKAEAAVREGMSLYHGANDLSPFIDGPISDEWLAQLDAALSNIRAAGLKVILHFAYSTTVAPGVPTGCDPNQPAPADVPPDAPLSVIAAHLAQLRPHLQANLDVISSVDAGFAGEWGEWHCSTNMLLSDENKPALFRTLYDGFPESLQINFRYPQDIFDHLEASPADKPRTANYQACYASGPDGHDVGTWPPDSPDQQNEMKNDVGSLIGSHAFVGLVVCNKESTNPDRLTCDTAVGPDGRSGEFLQMHVSYFDAIFDKERFGPAYAECWTDIVNRLGYRLQLDSATLPSTLYPGEDATVSITIDNEGFASMISPRTAYLVFQAGDRREQVALQADPRGWPAMSSSTFTETIRVPDDLPVGAVRVSLWLPDPSDSLQERTAYSVQMANVGVWDSAQALNVLAENVTVSARTLPATGDTVPWSLIAIACATLALGTVLTARARAPRARAPR